MRSIKVFFVVLLGLVVLSFALRLFIPLFIIGGVIALFILTGRRIADSIRRRKGYDPNHASAYRKQGHTWSYLREPLVYQWESYREPLPDVNHVEVK